MSNISESNAQQSVRMRWMTACEERGLSLGEWRRLKREHEEKLKRRCVEEFDRRLSRLEQDLNERSPHLNRA